jgi:hypothetical protein
MDRYEITPKGRDALEIDADERVAAVERCWELLGEAADPNDVARAADAMLRERARQGRTRLQEDA